MSACRNNTIIPLCQHYYLISRCHRIFNFGYLETNFFYSFPSQKFRLLLCKLFTRVCFGLISAGAGRTGMFIALSNILERVKAEGLLDVFQTVKSLRTQRPHMVQTVVRIHHTSSVLSPVTQTKKNHPLFLNISSDKQIFFFFQEQYDFCYKVVQDFVDIFSDYANFK